MATATLTLPVIAEQLNTQWERMLMLLELSDMAIDAIPSDTDNDRALALLNGMKEIIRVDMGKAHNLFEAVSEIVERLKSAEVDHV